MGDSVLTTERFVLFWNGWPSQWHPSPFELDGTMYNCCEQWMMAEKARVFDDAVSLTAIMMSVSPREQKSLGRRVRGFDAERWNSVCRGIVYRGNLAKFTSTESFTRVMLDTGDRTIVEASPMDAIWGIGLAKEDPRAFEPSSWLGTNWLGVALMQVRDELRRRAGLAAPEMDSELRRQLEGRGTFLEDAR
jgi:ribA/ribD-fused uncharacterized protein